MKQTIYIINEHTKYGCYTSAFDSKIKSDGRIKELLKQYSAEYKIVINNILDLPDCTDNEVFIDQFEVVLE